MFVKNIRNGIIFIISVTMMLRSILLFFSQNVHPLV